jgi:hypothetical protein
MYVLQGSEVQARIMPVKSDVKAWTELHRQKQVTNKNFSRSLRK